MIGLTVTSPFNTTGFWTVALTPKIAVFGWLMIGTKLLTPYIPKLLIVNVESAISSGFNLPARAFVVISLEATTSSLRLILSAPLITGTTNPLSIPTAIDKLT